MKLAALVGHINRSIDRKLSPADLVHEVRHHVGEAIREDEFIVECVERTVAHSADCLERQAPYRALHAEDERHWKIALFLWEPGFYNSPHQHNTWSVSGVMCNEIEVKLYDVGGGPRDLLPRRRFVAGRGESGYLIPPCIHALGNPHPGLSSVTLHVFDLSAEPEDRERDTIWFDDDVNPLDFYRDPRRPAMRDLQSALVLLRSIRSTRTPELLERIFALGSLAVRVDAYKQMVRCAPGRAAAMGDALLQQLRGHDRERFAALHRQVQQLPAHAQARPWGRQDEYALQHAIGLLMRSPTLTQQLLAAGVGAALPSLAPPVAAQLGRIVDASGPRLRLLSRMFDARARQDVLRLLPLVRTVAGDDELAPAWAAFEARHAATLWRHLSQQAIAFCTETAAAEAVSGFRRPAAVRDLLHYEAALLRLGAQHAELRASEALDVRPARGPRVTRTWALLACELPLATLLPRLRALAQRPADEAGAGMRVPPEVDALLQPQPGGSQTLLLFVACDGGPVRTMPVGAATGRLIAACDGSRSLDELALHLQQTDPALARPQDLQRTIERLAQAGVLGCMPAAAPAAASIA